MSVRLQDIAREAKVSYATVSRVLNNHKNVRAQTRTRVLEVLRRHQYGVKRSRARALSTEFNIELIFHRAWQNNTAGAQYFASVIAGAEAILQRLNCHLIVRTVSSGRLDSYFESLSADRSVDGVIIVYYDAEYRELYRRLQEQRIPCVLLQPRLLVEEAITVFPDNLGGARRAVEHLIALGHRRIAHLHSVDGDYEATERRWAYELALRDAGIPLTAEYLQTTGGWDAESGEQAMGRLLRLAAPPTAVFAANDSIAIGAMRACAAHGLKVPEDVSIVGFDDFYPEGFMMPALTTINYPIPTLVEVAIREVLDHLQHRDFHAQRILTPVRLMERQSTRRLSE